jgi:thymidylate synthase (FAD)
MKATFIDKMGSDDRVVDSARVSFAKTAAEYTPEQNAKLIAYLARHNHWNPFAHCQMTIHVKAPIFVARQLVKHQVGLVWNEVSRRYVNAVANSAVGAYEGMLNIGVAPEFARIILPLNAYTQWYWTGSLMAFARICKLRLDPHAQKETQDIAKEIAAIAAETFPLSWSALMGGDNEQNDGGSAFPEPMNAQCGGMTLRDYFAAAALVGLASMESPNSPQVRKEYLMPATAARAYRYADAMIKERMK